MKKIYLLIFIYFSFFTISEGQYSILHNFNGSTGQEPEGSLTLSNGKLYGMTYYGGPTSYGNVFSIDTDGNNYKDLFDFNGTNGAYPSGNVTISGGKLFGMTSLGGINGIGNIFSMDTNGKFFKDLHDFSSGYTYPEGGGSLIISGTVLYGMANAGGASDDGFIFSIDTNGGGYNVLFEFNGIDGGDPYGDLTLNGNKFCGTTGYGGTHNCGVVFSIDANGSNYKTLLNFDTTNGAYPCSYLTLLYGKLYGMTDKGGFYDSGCIFSIDTNVGGYKDLFDFNGPDGRFPGGSSSTLAGSMFYGTTNIGGLNDAGVIFSMDTNGSSFTDFFSFNVTNGELPSGVINDGNILYGMTKFGGAGAGVIFKYEQVGLGVNNILANTDEIKVYPNPNNGTFTLSLSNVNSASNIEVYNILGEKVYTETFPQNQNSNTTNLTGQPSGVYFYRVLKEDGGLVGEGKVIIQK